MNKRQGIILLILNECPSMPLQYTQSGDNNLHGKESVFSAQTGSDSSAQSLKQEPEIKTNVLCQRTRFHLHWCRHCQVETDPFSSWFFWSIRSTGPTPKHFLTLYHALPAHKYHILLYKGQQCCIPYKILVPVKENITCHFIVSEAKSKNSLERAARTSIKI